MDSLGAGTLLCVASAYLRGAGGIQCTGPWAWAMRYVSKRICMYEYARITTRYHLLRMYVCTSMYVSPSNVRLWRGRWSLGMER